MNPKLNKHFPHARTSEAGTLSIGGENDNARFTKTSVRDQAVLLLSIADIAKTEINNDGLSTMWLGDEDIPKLPKLSEPKASDFKWLTPRTETLKDLIVGDLNTSSDHYPSNRVRSVSIEYSPEQLSSRSERTISPLWLGPPEGSSANLVSPGVSPLSNRRLPFRKQSLRLSHKARKEHLLSSSSPMCSDVEEEEEGPARTVSFADTNSKKSKPLQPATAKGVIVKKILRKKFSWKNYPELEAFLIANREEYLRHSALNYTVQQKEYNNRLTEQLLDLATEHGYVFDEKEFSFVTVRDRIRCYFKSYVQSAKKRGILMGYAARKAGLLTEDDLEKSAGQTGRIFAAN